MEELAKDLQKKQKQDDEKAKADNEKLLRKEKEENKALNLKMAIKMNNDGANVQQLEDQVSELKVKAEMKEIVY